MTSANTLLQSTLKLEGLAGFEKQVADQTGAAVMVNVVVDKYVLNIFYNYESIEFYVITSYLLNVTCMKVKWLFSSLNVKTIHYIFIIYCVAGL